METEYSLVHAHAHSDHGLRERELQHELVIRVFLRVVPDQHYNRALNIRGGEKETVCVCVCVRDTVSERERERGERQCA